MATTTILSSITRTGTYPLSTSISAENNCGTVSISLVGTWTQQMITELPTINFAVYMTNGTKLLSVDFDLTTYISDNRGIDPVEPYTISLYNIPSSFTLKTTPIFNNSALYAHNALIESGMIDVFTTDANGIVDTNANNYGSELWTTPTSTFSLTISFDDSNIVPGGGGGGGTTIIVDTQVQAGSTNPVENQAIYNFVNSSISTNTAYFIGTFNSVQDLENYSGTVTNNDYAFVISTDSSGNTVYNRYKYSSETQQWNFEYALNNSSFTSNQWATINSGFTTSDKTKLDTIETGANKTIVDSSFNAQSTNPVQNATLTEIFTPMTQAEYDLLSDKDMPLYFIYEQ